MGSYTDTTLSDAGEIIGDGKIVVLESEKWIGKRFPLLDYINIGNKFKEGKWLVVLYHHNCSDCQAAMPKYRHAANTLADQLGEPRVVLVEMPPYADGEAMQNVGRQLVTARLSDNREWFAKTPIELAITDGVVTFFRWKEVKDLAGWDITDGGLEDHLLMSTLRLAAGLSLFGFVAACSLRRSCEPRTMRECYVVVHIVLNIKSVPL